MKQHLFRAAEEHGGLRLDVFVAQQLPELSRSGAQKLCEEGLVRVGDRPAAKNHRVQPGDAVAVTVPQAKPLEAVAQPIDLDVVYEDDQLIVVNKPQGLVVHPAPGHEDGTLVNALLFHCAGSLSGIGGVLRPGIVHRIDKDTSGLLVVAKTDLAHEHLSEQVKEHSFTRIYEAVVHGRMKDESGTVETLIDRNPRDRKKMAVSHAGGRHAVTHYRLLAQYRGYAHMELRLETGRTHQIRIHMAHIGHPVAGDPVYGPQKGMKGLRGQCLHARTLGFRHPVTGEELLFTSELPAYFQKVLTSLPRE